MSDWEVCEKGGGDDDAVVGGESRWGGILVASGEDFIGNSTVVEGAGSVLRIFTAVRGGPYTHSLWSVLFHFGRTSTSIIKVGPLWTADALEDTI